MSKKLVIHTEILQPKSHLSRDRSVPSLVHSGRPTKRLPAIFYRTEAGNEPVRDWLRVDISKEDRIKIGSDIKAIEMLWPVGLPLCGVLGRGLWEVRTTLQDRNARVIFCVHDEQMVLLHGFIKKDRTTSQRDIEVAIERKRQVERNT